MKSVYERLRKKLDDMGTGYPATESGVEIRILKRLFTEEVAEINLDRCIGCGLCVSTCETDAMHLVKKSDEQLYEPPSSLTETYMRIAQERGKHLMPE